MAKSKFINRIKFTELDNEGNVIFENKYKTNDDLIADIGFKYAIFNRNTIYRIQKRYVVDSHQNIRIEKIREIIPHRIEKRVVFIE